MSDEMIKETAETPSLRSRRFRDFYDSDDTAAIESHYLQAARRRWITFFSVAGLVVGGYIVFAFLGRATVLDRLRKATPGEVARISAQFPNDKKVQLACGYRETQEGLYKEAHQRMEGMVKRYPDDFDIWLGLARAAAMNGKGFRAIEAYQKAAQLNPRQEAPHVFLGQTYTEAGLYTDALAEYQQVLAIKPDVLDRNQLYGECLVRLGRLDEGMNHLLSVLRKMPMADTAFGPLTEAAIKLGRQTDLEDIVKFRLEVNTTYPYSEVRNSYARSVLSKPTPERLKEAERQSRVALRDYLPSNYACLAKVLQAQGKDKEALEISAQGLARDGNHEECLEITAELAGKLGDQARAAGANAKLAEIKKKEQDVDRLAVRIKRAPDDRQAYLSLAALYQARGRHGRAAETMHRLLEQRPGDTEAKSLLEDYRRSAIQELEENAGTFTYRPQYDPER